MNKDLVNSESSSGSSSRVEIDLRSSIMWFLLSLVTSQTLFANSATVQTCARSANWWSSTCSTTVARYLFRRCRYTEHGLRSLHQHHMCWESRVFLEDERNPNSLSLRQVALILEGEPLDSLPLRQVINISKSLGPSESVLAPLRPTGCPLEMVVGVLGSIRGQTT